MRGPAVRAVLAIATVPTAAAIASRANPVFAAIDDIGKPEFSPELDSLSPEGGP